MGVSRVMVGVKKKGQRQSGQENTRVRMRVARSYQRGYCTGLLENIREDMEKRSRGKG